MSDINLDQKAAIRKAVKEGFRVYRGKPDRLLIDLDEGDAGLTKLREQLEFLNGVFRSGEITFRVTAKWRSKSGKNWHVIVRSNAPLNAAYRLVLQAVLGSDLKKTAYDLARFIQGTSEPSILFRPPEKPQGDSHRPYMPTSIIDDDDIPF